jgi:hypothetical protein
MGQREALEKLTAAAVSLAAAGEASGAAFTAFTAALLPYVREHGAPKEILDLGEEFARVFEKFGASGSAFGEALAEFAARTAEGAR